MYSGVCIDEYNNYDLHFQYYVPVVNQHGNKVWVLQVKTTKILVIFKGSTFK